MELSDYQSQYLAYELTRRYPSDSIEKLAGTVASAQVDLNPHQVDAALFAFRSPLSRGALLADEVGLGKTIEAGLVIAQKWAERKRHILVVTPANLRKQWHQEMQEKFALPCEILETRSYNEAVKKGSLRGPFQTSDSIVICSYQFARAKAADVKATAWDLVVMDEAHRLRNVYKPSNVIANALKAALEDRNKLLLTATPLQNSLLELFGLVSFIDERTFGDLKSFKEQFGTVAQDESFRILRERLRPICQRTLRSQVTAYIPYTSRHSMLERFTPAAEEYQLYDQVSEYLRRDKLQALPASQRSLITLILQKLLASSTFAIAGALTTMVDRLKRRFAKATQTAEPLEDILADDYEGVRETAEEYAAEDSGDGEPLSDADRVALEAEIAELDRFIALAQSIRQNAKGIALLKVLGVAFAKAEEFGAERKAIIFTESRRTQDYLLSILAESAFSDGIVLFNGTNTDAGSKRIYTEWLERHRNTDRVTGSRTADMRSALVDYFREQGRIMIATEAGAEGVNLQFCSLVINYDLPWNPQRIEQRIGRCHRYGQKYDVVVVNFLNDKNEADEHVFKLLDEKFKLFEGVFGASDEVLGAIESGVDFEKRIAEIYRLCRHPEEIHAAFAKLQQELSAEINEEMTHTRQKLLENFDDEVREKLKTRKQEADASLGRIEHQLMQLTRHELDGHAEFETEFSFRLTASPFGLTEQDAPLGLYELPRRSVESHLYRLNHKLAETVVERAQARNLPCVEVTIRYGDHEGRITPVEQLIGKSGWLSLSQYSVTALDQEEEHLILTAICDDGVHLDTDTTKRLLTVPWSIGGPTAPSAEVQAVLDFATKAEITKLQEAITERNGRFFAAETEKLDGWADDLKLGLEREIKEIDRLIREVKRTATLAPSLEEKLAAQKQIRELETTRSQKRRSLFDAQDAVDRQRDQLIADIEGKLAQRQQRVPLYKVRWSVR